MSTLCLVVPCFNEAARLDLARFHAFAAHRPDVRFLFVDDGSTDGTLRRLQALIAEDPARFGVLRMPENRGKAEAVRRGMLHALAGPSTYAGFWDADLATPLEEIPAFVGALEDNPAVSVVLGSRVRLLGRSVERRTLRHYLGRVFATAASLTLGLPVYDTQCGAKLFRNVPAVRSLFAEPFTSRWIFDVELLARVVSQARAGGPSAHETVLELPLRRWRDVAGSKLRTSDFLRVPGALWAIHRRYLRTRHRDPAPQQPVPVPAPVLLAGASMAER